MKTKELLEQATPAPWYVLEAMGQKFVAAKPTPDHPYFEHTRNMDVAGVEDYPRKQADLELIAIMRNNYADLVDSLQKIANLWPPDGMCPDILEVSGPNDGKSRAMIADAAIKVARAALAKEALESAYLEGGASVSEKAPAP